MAKIRGVGKLLRRSWLEGAIDTYLLERVDFTDRDKLLLIHASELLDEPEKIFWRLIGQVEEGKAPSARLKRMFDDGLDVQRRYIRYFRSMGILDEPEGWNEDEGIEIIDWKYGIIGHIDCRIWTPEGIRVPVELKAYGDDLFRRYRYRPRVDHVHQLQMYICLDDAPYGYLLPENKNNQEINPIKVKRDDVIINAALTKAVEVWSRVKSELGGSYVEPRSKLLNLLTRSRSGVDPERKST